MNRLRSLALAAIAVACLTVAAPTVHAQISVDIGVAPDCPYGYFDYPPYDCAPWGYYGPEWFNGGIFIGAGPWYHGHHRFRGHVDSHFDPRSGYSGPLPHRGERGDWERHNWKSEHFRGRDVREQREHHGEDREHHGGDHDRH